MKPNIEHGTAVLSLNPVLIGFSPGNRTVPRRLHITLWQTHSWIKKIIKLQKGSDTCEKAHPKPRRFK